MSFLVSLIWYKCRCIWLWESNQLISWLKIFSKFEIIVFIIDEADIMIIRSLKRGVLIGFDNVELGSNVWAVMEPCNDFWKWCSFNFIISEYLITDLEISHALGACWCLNLCFLWKTISPKSTIDESGCLVPF